MQYDLLLQQQLSFLFKIILLEILLNIRFSEIIKFDLSFTIY